MERRKRDGNHSPPKNKVVEDLEWNENGYSEPDSNKTKINYTEEYNEAHKNTLKEEILQVINENVIEMLLDMVTQNIQEALKKFQDNKNKDMRKPRNK
jgi:predicted house-cleaning noncanonical NTP pyrophosphatase (MazG superfamily)